MPPQQQGLAAMGMQQGIPMASMEQQQQGGQQQMPTVDEIVQLLQQGISPQELIEAGVPQELVQQAIQILQQAMQEEQQEAANAPAQVQPQPQAPQQPPQGLAARGM